QDVGVGEFDRHLFRIGDEVGREVAAVELHAFNHVELEFEALGFLDRDHAFLADLLHRFGDLLADDGVAISRDYADLVDLFRTEYRLRAGLEVLDDLGNGDVDAALQVHRIHAGRDRLHAFANDRLGQNCRRGGAVARDVVGLRGDFAQHLRAHVLELVLELDFLSDGDAVLGDARRAEALVEDNVAALRPQRHLDGVGEDVDTLQNPLARVPREFHVLGCHLATLSDIKFTKFMENSAKTG